MAAPIPDKRTLRAEMRRIRRSITDAEERSERIRTTLESMPSVLNASTVMGFTAIHGEPDLGPFMAGCRARGQVVVVPEDEPDAATVDVVLVPGVAFTADGHRLGQGGGWYDRFLVGVRRECVTVGVCFAEQVVDRLPLEGHDVVLDVIVTDEGAPSSVSSAEPKT